MPSGYEKELKVEEMGSSKVLQLPAYKILLEQLQNAEKISFMDNGKVHCVQWKVIFCEGKAVNLSNVWIQGHVEAINLPTSAENDGLIMKDITGKCLVVGLSRIPQPKGWVPLKCGDFILVVGHVLSAGACVSDDQLLRCSNEKLCAKLKVIKIHHMEKNNHCTSGLSWRQEVFEAQSQVVQTSLMQ